MTSPRSAAPLALLALAAACGGSDTTQLPSGAVIGSGSPSGGVTGTPANVLAISVNGTLCSAGSYGNKPCVSVTVCSPGTSTCQTIDDVLLDTGSTGLRVYRQVLTVPLRQVTLASGALAECAQWGDATSDWGPVQLASVVLGSEPPVQVPVHVLDRTFGSAPSSCGTPQPDPAAAGFNGILGVGLFAQDCGPGCAATADTGIYYTCNGTACSPATVPLATQVQNPVGLLPEDNNGVLVDLPSVPSGGAPSVEGQLLLGIGTRTNNVPATVSTYALDGNGYLTTTFAGSSYHGFIDTGSNALFFPPPPSGLPACAAPNSLWYCPPSGSPVALSATNSDVSGQTSSTVSFRIANFLDFANSPNNVSAEIGGTATPQAGFDWGLPFLFGRRVYVGLEGKQSSLGTGPFFAY